MVSTYNNSIPQSTDRLVISQNDLLNNFSQLDTSFGVDHVDYSDGSANNGKHTAVTTPDQGSHPATAADEPKLYALDNGTLGTLQYSRAGDSAGTGGGLSAITGIHSGTMTTGYVTLASATTVNILDLTSINDCCGTIYTWSVDSGATGTTENSAASVFFWDPNNTTASFRLNTKSMITGDGGLSITGSGSNILKIQNTAGVNLDIYWTIKIERIAP